MKKLFFAAALSLTASLASAAPTITCTHAGFSELTIQLVPYNANQFSLRVVKTGPTGDYMPSVGERSLMNVDPEVSNKDYMILRSNENEEQRVFEVSFRRADLKQTNGTFPAAIRISQEESDTTFASYEMSCTKN
ncbi:MAG: hypothetical protein JSU04_15595 [Bdellovibrionales bacterium]|nr:hypothetical protein [Bdellovibrionales bacterium]